MQSASAALDAAVAAKVQDLAPPDVRVDWDRTGTYDTTQGNGLPLDDLSADVERVSVTRSLSTDLPEGVKHFTGSAAATGSVTLARPAASLADPATESTASFYSPLNTASPLFAKKRVAAPAKVALGFRTSAGVERLDQLTGVARILEVDGPGRQATLELLDNVDRDFRRHLTMPMVLADDRTFGSPAQKPGLSAAWVVDWVMRRCGYAAAPPQRASCILSATLAGSGYPEVGSIQEWRGANYTKLAFPPLTPGFSTAAKFIAGVALAGITSQQCDLVTQGTANANDGGRLFMQCWARPDTLGGTTSSPLIAYRTGNPAPYASLYCDANGRLQLLADRGGGWGNQSTGNSGPTGITTGAWHYLAAYVEFGSTTNVWLRVNGTQTGPHTLGSGGITGGGPFNTVSLRGKGANFADAAFDGIVEAVQVTTQNGAGAPPAWDSAWTPTYDHGGSLNELVATPVVDREEAAAILGELAAAELGMWGVSESGRPYWRTRRFFTTAPQTVSQATLTTTTSVLDLSVSEDVDSVRNVWKIKARPPQVGSPTADVWSLEDFISIPAFGTRTIWADFDQPAAYVDTALSTGTGATGSRYNASTAKNGAGDAITDLTVTVTAFAQSAKVTITSPHTVPVWLVGNAGVAGVAQGVPSLRLAGQPVLFDVDQTVQTGIRNSPTSDATSVGLYGERVYEYPDNPWLQDLDSIDLTAADGLALTKDPRPVLRGLRIVANPRLQLGDRVTIVDADGLKLSGDWHVAGITTEQSDGGGMTQSLEVRAV